MKALQIRLEMLQQHLEHNLVDWACRTSPPGELATSGRAALEALLEALAIAETLPDQPGNVMVLGCICPAGANETCKSTICPRREAAA